MKNGTSAQKELGVRIHATVFLAVIALLVLVNLWVGSPYWVLWVVLGWGVGLFSHWFFASGPGARRTGHP
jgi:hypothetical protein